MAYHQRAPSLGELHQELEQEQEAQVVRSLYGVIHGRIELTAIADLESAPGDDPPTAGTASANATTCKCYTLSQYCCRR